MSKEIKNEINNEKKEIMDKIKVNIDSYLNGLPEKEKLSGAVLVSVGGEKIISQGFGMANFELEVPNTSSTKFRIGSVTKQFTAVAVLQLMEKGLLSLEDTLDKYIADYPKGDKVTIHHLLTHTSGIFNHTSIEGFMKNIMRNKHTVEELVEEFKGLPYDFKPGAMFKYNNSGYILLGYIIEKVSGMSYREYLQKNIFNKFSMESTGYDSSTELIKNRASGYSYMGEDRTLVNCDFIDMTVPYAAGALYSTVEDLNIWNNALFSGQVISHESLDNMLGKHISAEDEGFYGYGVFIKDLESTGTARKRVHHGGGIPGFFSSNSIFPNEDIQIIMVTNVANEYFGQKVEKIEAIVLESLA